MRKLILTTTAAVAVLAGCASPFAGSDMPPGSPRDAVVARMGPPQRVVPMPSGGQRLQYSLQPVGQHAWMVDLDASGRVVQSRQVLTEGNFHRIEAGKWTRDDVEREFGRPAWIDSVASWRGPIMTYRWRDTANSDMFYYVYLDERNVVQRAHPGMEFVNAPNDRN
jgi:hypothetical protein